MTKLHLLLLFTALRIEEEARRQAEKEDEPSIVYLHVLLITALMHRLIAYDLANLLLL